MTEPVIDSVIDPVIARRIDSRWIAGVAAVWALRPSQVFFREVGRKLLPAGTQKIGARMAGQMAVSAGLGAPLEVQALVRIADAGAREIAAVPAALPAALARATSTAITRGAVRGAAATAARQIGRAAGRAAALGFVLDGGIAAVDAVRRVRRGEASRGQAAKHVAREAVAGAVATGAGVLAVSAVVALTGGIGAPAAFFLGAGASMSAKHLIKRALG